MRLFKTVSFGNVPMLLCLANFFKASMFILPVVVIVYQYKGLSVGDFFLVQGIFATAAFALEIPTGYIGDLFSRKKVICIAMGIYFIGYVVLFAFHGFWCVIVAEMLWGLTLALLSGTTEAYLYDVLKAKGEESTYMQVQSKVSSYECVGTCIATFTGGIIYNYFGADLIILLEVIFIFIGFCMVLFLPDLPDSKRIVEEGTSKWQDIMQISKNAVNQPYIKWMMLFPACFGTVTLVMFWSLQPLMEHNEVPVALFGIFIGLNQFFRIVSVRFLPKLFECMKMKHFTVLIFVFLSFGSVLIVTLPEINNLYLTYAILLILGVIISSQVGLGVVSKTMINHKIESDERATVLSVGSMIAKVLNAAVMVAVKILIDGNGIGYMLIWIIPIVLLLTFISLVNFLRINGKTV
jgi:MFS family permease